MATTKSRKRSAKCIQCGTVSIFPRWSKSARTGDTVDIWHCPVCKHELGMTGNVIEKTTSDVERIEEFFSGFVSGMDDRCGRNCNVNMKCDIFDAMRLIFARSKQ
jgi:hypothetical protein